MLGKIKDIFLVSAPNPIRLVVCTHRPFSAAEVTASFYDKDKERILIVPETQDIEAVAKRGKTLVMLDGENATLHGQPCNAITFIYPNEP